MGAASYPAGSDAASYLTGAGLTVSTGMQTLLNSATTVGRQIFELQCGGRQFLGDAATSVRYYDPPVNQLSRVRIDDCYSVSSVVYLPLGGTAYSYVLDQEYFLRPENAAARQIPFEGISFRRRWTGPITTPLRKSLQVTAKWGFAATIPEAAWEAMIVKGLLARWPQVMLAATGGLASWTEADVTESSAPKLWSDLKDSWTSQYAEAVRLYRRVEF